MPAIQPSPRFEKARCSTRGLNTPVWTSCLNLALGRLVAYTHCHPNQHTQVKDLGSGNFGLARLERDVATNALVAIKYLPRGHTVRAPHTWLHTLHAAPQQASFSVSRRIKGLSAWHRRHVLVAHLRGRRHVEAWARWGVAVLGSGPWAPGCRFPQRGLSHPAPVASQVDENVARELVCHRMLRHNNVVLFKEARPFGHCMRTRVPHLVAAPADTLPLHLNQLVLTPSHLAIVMEFASGACAA
jgi:serine/threonine protein kinase